MLSIHHQCSVQLNSIALHCRPDIKAGDTWGSCRGLLQCINMSVVHCRQCPVCTSVHQCGPVCSCTSVEQCLISEVSESHLPLPEACPNRPNPGDHCCCLVFLSISTWTSKGIGEPYTGWKTLCTLDGGIRSRYIRCT